uniref:Uncharacterized protein n=1 Tax=Lygus hesperus TaxID=30085 RepID=A0A0K8TF96_LYGHE
MWTPGSVAASTKIMGRMLWPLARSSIRSQGVVRGFTTGVPTWNKRDEDLCKRTKCWKPTCASPDSNPCFNVCRKMKPKPSSKKPNSKRDQMKCFTEWKPPKFNPKCPRPEEKCESNPWKPNKCPPEVCESKCKQSGERGVSKKS